ncbi:hypothetical protein Bbelb_024280 [Branchiostoma belcheri]|nr:hypothetical protein Bbelb_024280 [Branchiostoma belcheri]
MDPLHRQTILDCYDDLARDMNPGLVLLYSEVQWRDGDPGLIRARARTEGPVTGAKALLDKLLDLSYDSFDDFVQSLREVPYDHLVKQLLETRARLRTAVEWRPAETPSLAIFPRRLKTFVGREDVFSRIDACLGQNQTCLIKGLGGVGKTSVAIEYGHRCAGRYPGGVFWVRLASKGDLCAGISQYSVYISELEKGSVHCTDDLSCESVKSRFRRHLTNSKQWLLVADGVVRETMKDLEFLLPHTLTPTMHVLLTSNEYQRLDMERIAVVSLAPFSDTEALSLFNKTVRPSSKDDRRDIKSLSRSRSVREYHDKYVEGNATEKVDLLNEADIEQFTNRTIRRAFDITLQRV